MVILTLQPKESRSGITDFDGSASSIRRSHSQTQLNKPSSDLLGLTLHAFDPIDPVTTTTNTKTDDTNENKPNEAENSAAAAAESSSVKSSSGITDLTSTLLNMSMNSSANTTSTNAHDNSSNVAGDTSHEVQDILSEFQANAGAPALPPKQNASNTGTLNRPSSVQREKISNSLIALPRPPSRMSQTSVLSRPRGSPSPAPNSEASSSSNFASNTLGRKFSTQLSRQESGGGLDSPGRKLSSNESGFDMMKTPSYGFSRGPSPLTLGT